MAKSAASKEAKEKKKLIITPEPASPVAPNVLARIVALAKEQKQIQDDLDANAEQRKVLNKKFVEIAGGYQAEGSLDKEIEVPKMGAESKHREAMIKWLKENNHQDLIKSSIIALFSQDAEDKRLESAIASLTELKVPFDNFESVNANSLKALIKELIEDGSEIPFQDLGIFIYKQTEIKIKKDKKEKVS